MGCLKVAGGLVLAIFALLFFWVFGETYQRSTLARPDVSVAPIDISADEIATSFAVNEAAAKARFGSQSVRVTGKIQSVELNATGGTILYFKTDQGRVTAHMLDSAAQGARSLQTGSLTSVLCDDPYLILGIVVVRHCIFSTSPALERAMNPPPIAKKRRRKRLRHHHAN